MLNKSYEVFLEHLKKNGTTKAEYINSAGRTDIDEFSIGKNSLGEERIVKELAKGTTSYYCSYETEFTIHS